MSTAFWWSPLLPPSLATLFLPVDPVAFLLPARFQFFVNLSLLPNWKLPGKLVPMNKNDKPGANGGGRGGDDEDIDNQHLNNAFPNTTSFNPYTHTLWMSILKTRHTQWLVQGNKDGWWSKNLKAHLLTPSSQPLLLHHSPSKTEVLESRSCSLNSCWKKWPNEEMAVVFFSPTL